MASSIKTTHVYKVNSHLIIADSPTEAINIFNDYYNKNTDNYKEEVQSLKIITDENYICPSSNALIRYPSRVSLKSVCDWIKTNPYTDTISNITDVTPEEIIGDFIKYMNNLQDA